VVVLPVSIRDQITRALDSIPNLREYDRFQEMAFLLARAKWPGLRLTRKTRDRGADAIDDESAMALACGWNGDVQKLRQDCERLSDERPEIRKLVFATSLAVDEIEIKGWKEKIKEEFALELIAVMQRDWIIGELSTPEHRWIAHEFLDLPVGNFADLRTHLASIRSAALRVTNAWKTEHAYQAATLIDLRMKEKADDDQVLRRNDLAAAIHPGGLIALLGASGCGKTHSLISLADDISAAGRFVPVLISLRRWGQHGGRLLDFIISEPAFRQQGVSVETFATAVEAGKVLLLLNGWNEVSDAQRRRMQDELRTLETQFAATTCVITARTLPSISPFPRGRVLTLAELADDEIQELICRAGIADADALFWRMARAPRVLALARVPLFLRELIAEASSGRDLPATRYGVLKAMVARATAEHRQLLEEAGYSGVEDRYLGSLAWRMTEDSVTGLAMTAARGCAMEVSAELTSQGLLASNQLPAAALELLSATHLLIIEEGGTQVTFSHQLVQEYFTAVELARRLRGPHADDATRTATSQWQWSIPIAMCIEKLSSEHDALLAAALLRALAIVDFEASCRAIAIHPELWSHVREIFSGGINTLAQREDVNAKWLGARWAAATGQAEFSQVVLDGLAGYPPDSESCFAGVPSESLQRALGSAAADLLLERYEPVARLRALDDLSTDNGRAAVPLASVLAARDPDSSNRLRAYDILFRAGGRAWLRPFVNEVRRRGGWSLPTVVVVKSLPHCSLRGWRRRMSRLRSSATELSDRIKIQNAWMSHDPEGARQDAITEYDWCRSRAQVSIGEWEILSDYCRLCLRRAAKADPAWAASRMVQDITLADVEKLGSFPLKVLSPSDRVAIVQRLILDAVQRDEAGGRRTEILADLAPESAAATVLRSLCNGPRLPDADETKPLVRAVAKIPRESVIVEICRRDYDQLPIDRVRILIDALMRGRDSVALQVIPADLRNQYRGRLHQWRALLPLMDQETAHLWADLALLLGEVGHHDDAPLVLDLLKADRQRVIDRQARRRAAVAAYLASNRTTAPPGPHDACSYELIYDQALSGFSGESLVPLFIDLLNDAEQFGFAAHWLANQFGAPRNDTFANSWSENRFQLVSELGNRSPEFVNETAHATAAIRAAVDRELVGDVVAELARGASGSTTRIMSALVAVARFEGAAAAGWLMEQVERHFGDGCWDDMFEQITLVGCVIDGNRALPFVRRTIAEAQRPTLAAGDQSYRIVRSLAVLFYSHAAEAAVQTLQSERGLVPDYAFRVLLAQIRWAKSDVIDPWLRETLRNRAISAELRASAAELLINRSRDAADVATILECATWFVSDVDVQRAEHAYILQRLIGDVAAVDEAARGALLVEAGNAPTREVAIAWLKIVPQIGGVVGVLTAFDLVERFGEDQLPVIGSLAPMEQMATHLTFGGWAFLMRRAFHFYPQIMSRLFAMLESSDEALRRAARRAILWIERERIQGHSPSVGMRAGHIDPSLPIWPYRICRDGRM